MASENVSGSSIVRLVLHAVRIERRVALGDLHLIAVVVAGAIEPRAIVVGDDLDDERVAFPICRSTSQWKKSVGTSSIVRCPSCAPRGSRSRTRS
jgi:hypothetical protein